ncbi:MAG: DNA repair protein RadC [Sphingobium sp.]
MSHILRYGPIMGDAGDKGKAKDAAKDTSGPAPNAGHRARLRQRLADGGPDALMDHEILEYLLALAIPRRDTKPLAKTLIARFGSLGGVLTAEWPALGRVDGLGETSIAAIKIVQAAMLRMLRQEVAEQPILSSWQALLDYLQADMAHLGVERVRVLHLNSRNMLIRDDHMGDGSIDSAAIYVREVIKRAVDLSSASLIIVHNHPSGAPDPSRQDIEITRQLVQASKTMGINVLDHIIVGKGAHRSFRAMGLL